MNNPLPNPLHESFARAIAEGLSPTEAYRLLKPTAKNHTTLGSRLWNRMDIRIRISEIVDEAVQERKLTIQQKIALLEKQIEGKEPTKVRIDSKGRKEATFDMLGAIQLHSRLCGDFDGLWKQPNEPVLALQFHMVGRDEPATPELMEEWERMNKYV
jgi:hypothetical protein